ncbi:MAG TPA: hypothetical protein DCY74_05125 [Clostridiales bacterium]|jgi:creatinine amidohydrolase|nr:hypothetical protein [Clostridiales bacterium]HBE13533.1 hypothetical protein [Clostridiales bacterium]HCG36145.1 hypothetical protein [Clostridiales bacterium]
MLWENLREEEFPFAIERSRGVCCMIIGSLEKHGQHLPVGCDTQKGGKILELAAEQEEAVVFPRFYFGDMAPNHSMVASQTQYGSIALSTRLLFDLLDELCDEIARNGFHKILLFSSHGGNTALLSQYVRHAVHTRKSYLVYYGHNKLVMPPELLKIVQERGRDAFPMLTDDDMSTLRSYTEQKKTGGHACFGETALMLGTYPHLVHLERMYENDGHSRHRVDHLTKAGLDWGLKWYANFPDAYSGDHPDGCTQSIGEACVKIAVERAATMIRVLKTETETETIHRELSTLS